MAEALSAGRTVREATKKSDVVRLKRSPQMPIPTVSTETTSTATTPKVAHGAHGRSTTSVKARSLRSAARTYHQPIATSTG